MNASEEQQNEEQQTPWSELAELVQGANSATIHQFLEDRPPGEAARIVSRMDEEDRHRLMECLDPGDAADLVAEIPDAQAAEMFEGLEPETAAAIVEELESDEQADLIAALDHDQAEGILDRLDPAVAEQTRQLASYPASVAGGLMQTEILQFMEDATVASVVDDLRRRGDQLADAQVQYVFVSSRDDKLRGVLRMRDLLLKGGGRLLRDIMIPEPVAVRADTSLEELADVFDRHAFLGVPIVDAEQRLIGIVQRSDVEEALGEQVESDYLKSQGIVGGEEFRSMHLLSRARRRLSWLSINIVLNMIAASVIAMYQDTLSSVIALAVFLPIISDMSGCSGNQAVAVSIRELTLGLVKPFDLAYVWLKEVGVGLINGVVLGLGIGAIAWLWQGNPWLGVVVGTALAANTLVAVSIGGIVPLVLRRFRVDPALASGPILTTLTDMCGFLLALSLATAMLPRLTGA